MLEYRTEKISEAVVVRIAGEVDMSNAHALRQELQQRADHNHLILDLSAIEYFDLSGVEALEGVSAFCMAHSRLIVLASPSHIARRVFDLIQLGRSIPIFDSREEARAYLQSKLPTS